jgi:hypothetical protein
MRQLFILAAVLFVAIPAFAEDVADGGRGAGRYAIQSSDDGFVRLDTETGAVSHCTRVGDTWHCDAIAEDKAALERQVQTLSRQVETLAAEVGRLGEELAALKAAPTEPQTKLTPDEEREFDKAIGFAERLMRRFFEMVRDLKGEERQSI